jgi:translation initiation factor IF-2
MPPGSDQRGPKGHKRPQKEFGLSKDKVRVYQLARELDVESKDLVEMLQAAGADVKNHMTAIDADIKQLAEDLVSGKVKPGAPRVAPPPMPPPAMTRSAPVPPPKPAKPAEIPDPRKKKPAAMPSRTDEDDADTAKSEADHAHSSTKPAEPVVVPAEQPVAETPDSASDPEPPAAVDPSPATPTDVEPARPAAPQKVIPTPGRGRIMSMGTSAPNPGSGARSSPPRDRRSSAPPRPIVALPPTMSPPPASREGDRSPQPPGPKTQKPVMKLPADQMMRGGKLPVPPMPGSANPFAPVEEEGDDRSGKGHQGGAHVGREERQKRRGQKALERRIVDPNATEEDEENRRRRGGARHKLKREAKQAKATGPIPIFMPSTVRAFCEATGIKAAEILFKLLEITGSRPTINSSLTEEEVGMLALAYEIEVEIKKEKGTEEIIEESLFSLADPEEDRIIRPPVVTFMGHVDHGKTSLMDRIRRTNVVAGEAGGITQHIGAYQVAPSGDRLITFLDTPGHEAFTAMRARGANVTDVVVLVVAANDGVMPQTEEAINHAKAADVPIIVAMNKADLPGANFERVQQQLSAHQLIPEVWGGDTIMVPTSATTGAGIDQLLESILMIADLKELKANPKRTAIGSCIEATMQGDKGVKATLMVLNGTLHVGDVIVCGPAFGRVRSMLNDQGEPVDEAGPATPVLIYGLDEVPGAGERFFVIDDLARAREIAEERRSRERVESQTVRQHVSLDKLYNEKAVREVQELKLILKVDVRGSLEAIKVELAKLDHEEVKIKLLHDAVGAVNESDVLLADTSDAIIIAFQVVPDNRAESLAREKGVEIRRYSIIYQVSDDIRKAMEGMLIPDKKEVQLGRAVVQETFSISRFGTIAGCRVIQGTIERSAQIRVIRDGTVIGTYPIESLKRHKDDAREVRDGLECGIKIAHFDDVKKGDVLEAFKIEEVKRTF